MSAETKLIRALAEDLAVEVLASYAPEDFKGADFTSLGQAAIYLTSTARSLRLHSRSSLDKFRASPAAHKPNPSARFGITLPLLQRSLRPISYEPFRPRP